MNALVNTNAIIPTHGFPKSRPEMPFVLDDHFVENLEAESAYQSLNMGSCIRRFKGSWDTSDAHYL